MSSTGISILGKNGSSLEAINSVSNKLKIDIAGASHGSLSVSDSTSQSTLSSINSALGGTISTSDSTAQSTLSSINSALGGSLSVSDSTSQASLSTIAGDTTSLDNKFVQGYSSVSSGGSGLVQVLAMGKDQSGNLDPLNVDSQGHLKITLNDIESGISNSIPVSDATAQSTLSQIESAVELIDDIVLTDGNAYSASSSKGVMLLAKDNSGNFKPVELNSSSELKVSSSGSSAVSASATTLFSSQSVSNSANVLSSAVDLNAVKSVSIFGNVSDFGAEIEIFVSSDDTTYYQRTDKSIFSDYSTGDFGFVLDVNARYLKIKYTNSSGSSKVISAVLSHKS